MVIQQILLSFWICGSVWNLRAKAVHVNTSVSLSSRHKSLSEKSVYASVKVCVDVPCLIFAFLGSGQQCTHKPFLCTVFIFELKLVTYIWELSLSLISWWLGHRGQFRIWQLLVLLCSFFLNSGLCFKRFFYLKKKERKSCILRLICFCYLPFLLPRLSFLNFFFLTLSC